MHAPKPWYRKFNDTWYVQLGKQQIPLAKGKAQEAEAFQRFYALMAQQDVGTLAVSSEANLASLCDLFLDWSQLHNDRQTYAWYRRFLQDFCDRHGLVTIARLRPFHVTQWVDAHAWGPSTQRAAITAIKRVLNWATAEGFIDANPLKALRKPEPQKRERVISPTEHKAILDATDAPFRLFLLALRQTGARPGEVASVTAEMTNADQGVWIFRHHKTANKVRKPRIIYLSPCMVTLTRLLMAARPQGPLFLNRRNRPWTRNAIRCRMRRLRRTLKLDGSVVAYAYRHTFATEGLANGVPIATMAELLGHADTTMLSDHYNHLCQKTDHLRQAVLRAGS